MRFSQKLSLLPLTRDYLPVLPAFEPSEPIELLLGIEFCPVPT